MNHTSHSDNHRLPLASSLLLLSLGILSGCDQASPVASGAVDDIDSGTHASTGSDFEEEPDSSFDVRTAPPPIETDTIRGVTFYSKEYFEGQQQTIEIPSSYAGRDYKGEIASGIEGSLNSVNVRPKCTLKLYSDKNSEHDRLKLETTKQTWWATKDVTDPNGKPRTLTDRRSFKINCSSHGSFQPPARLMRKPTDVRATAPVGDYFDLWPQRTATSNTKIFTLGDKLKNSWLTKPTGGVKLRDNAWVKITATNGVVIDSLFSSRTFFFNDENLPTIGNFLVYNVTSQTVPKLDCSDHWAQCFDESRSCSGDDFGSGDFVSLYNCQGRSYCTYDERCVDIKGDPVGG